jgi:hypothetical protein
LKARLVAGGLATGRQRRVLGNRSGRGLTVLADARCLLVEKMRLAAGHVTGQRRRKPSIQGFRVAERRDIRCGDTALPVASGSLATIGPRIGQPIEKDSRRFKWRLVTRVLGLPLVRGGMVVGPRGHT